MRYEDARNGMKVRIVNYGSDFDGKICTIVTIKGSAVGHVGVSIPNHRGHSLDNRVFDNTGWWLHANSLVPVKQGLKHRRVWNLERAKE